MATITTGVYKITNTTNNKSYIGQSVNIEKRWSYYRHGSKDHTPILFAIRKYGLDNFTFEIIEECDREMLNEREIYWIKEANTISPKGYNLSTGGRKTTWMYTPSRATLEKRSKALKGQKRTDETKRKMSIAQKGRTFSEDHREKLRLAHLGQIPWNKGIPTSETAKRKMIASKTGVPAVWRNKPVVRGDGVVFESIKQAAQDINATYGGIIRVCKGERNKIYGHTFRYVEGGSSSQL